MKEVALQCSLTDGTNVNKVVMKILQGSVISQTVLGGQLNILQFQTSYSIYVCQKLLGSRQRYYNNKQAYFFGPPCSPEAV